MAACCHCCACCWRGPTGAGSGGATARLARRKATTGRRCVVYIHVCVFDRFHTNIRVKCERAGARAPTLRPTHPRPTQQTRTYPRATPRHAQQAAPAAASSSGLERYARQRASTSSGSMTAPAAVDGPVDGSGRDRGLLLSVAAGRRPRVEEEEGEGTSSIACVRSAGPLAAGCCWLVLVWGHRSLLFVALVDLSSVAALAPSASATRPFGDARSWSWRACL